MASATEPGPLSEPEAKSATQLEKELKTKRSRLAREARAKDRNAKRQLKAEAKRARKENVKRSGKWTKEHQLEIKDKMKALKPVKDEKKRLRLLTRSKMLEIQAAKLLEDSRRAAREYERMTAKKERAEAAAAEATAKKTEADLEKGYIALEDDDSPSASPDEGNDEDSPPKAADAVPADEVAIKKRRESDAGSVRSTASNPALDPDVSMQDAEVEKPATKESKKQSKKKSKKPSTNKASVEDPKLLEGKRKRDSDAIKADAVEEPTAKKEKKEKKPKDKGVKEAELEPEAACLDEAKPEKVPKEAKKEKKEKKPKDKGVKEAELEPEAACLEVAKPEKVPREAKKEKKEKKPKDKGIKEAELEPEAACLDEAKPEKAPKEAKKDNKHNKDKKTKKSASEKKDKKPSEGASAEPAKGENWNVDELEGGADRQSKFLRLLGAKKSDTAVTRQKADGKAVPKVKSLAAEAEEDIQRQFEAGMKKKESNGQRRGLGA